MKLVIAFLLYRQHSLPYLPQFLSSLTQASDFLIKSDCQILIGDNSGEDDSNRQFFKDIDSIGDKKIEFFDFKTNLGFSQAYNILINRTLELKTDYFLMLNPDIFIDKSAISNLLKEIDKDPLLGSVSPKILHWDFQNNHLSNVIDSGGIVLKSGLTFKDIGQGQIDKGQIDKAKILGPSGAVALFRTSALLDINENGEYFDENFFMYKEDCDLIYRLSLNNWLAKLVPQALFYHDRSASGGSFWQKIRKRRKRSRQERIWSFRGQHYLFLKHWSKQSSLNKFIISIKIIKIFIFSLLFEQFILKEYRQIASLSKLLTNKR
jgi:GT2 family glycosyltransferase